MNDYLPKPLKEEQVIALFNKYIPSENWVEIADMNSSSSKYVDIDSMKKLFGDEPTIIHDFLLQFTEHFGQEMNKLRAALAEKNQSNVFTIAHNLKTTVSSLNANTELLAPLKLIEQYKKTEPDWNLIKMQIDILNNAEPQIKSEITTLQKELLT
jgi:HPt (histidine-containing phosphotransfer) domain-containing protein